MANIDVSELLSDPDFTDEVTLIRRTSTVNVKGRNELAEYSSTIIAVVQGPTAEDLQKFPDLAEWTFRIAVWYQGVLCVGGEGSYSDIVIWNGRRYEAKFIDEDYSNYGAGFTKAFFIGLESVDA